MTKNALKNPIIVALDVDQWDEMVALVESLKGCVGAFKVGKQLFTRFGPRVVEWIHEQGEQVFLDLKFHDIPNTVAKASEVATELGVFMFNVHVAGGHDMMWHAVEASAIRADKLGIERPIVLGVTMLTSMSELMFHEELRGQGSLREHVQHLAGLAQSCKMSGVVASPQEIRLIRDVCDEDFVIVTPGVRPEWASKDDQHRVMTPGEAMKAGADYLVIGRPITKAADPVDAVQRILKEF